MKLFSDDAQAAIESGDVMVSGAVEIMCDPPFRVFGGYGEITIASSVFTGIGHRGLVQVSGGAIGGTAQGITLTLSGVDPAVADLVDEDGVKDAPCTLRRLILNGAGTILHDAQVFGRGKVDQLLVQEIVGGAASISVAIETAARALGRSGGRMRTDADQRLIKAADGGFRSVSYAAQKTLYWGGKPPANAQVLTTLPNGFNPAMLSGIF